MKKDQIDVLVSQWVDERPDLDPQGLGIVVRVNHLAKVMTDESDAALLAAVNLSHWEYDVLSTLRRQGDPYTLSATNLAKESRLTTSAMTNRIDRLEQRSFVTRLSDQKDRRVVMVSLTKQGQTIIKKAIEVRINTADKHLGVLKAIERKNLTALLKKLLNQDS